MTNPQEPPRPDDGGTPPGVLESLAKHYKELNYGIIGAAAVVALVAVVLAFRTGWAGGIGPEIAVDVVLVLASVVVTGLAAAFRTSDWKLTEVEKARLLLLSVGATVGLAIALIGLSLPFFQKFSVVFAGGPEAWRKNGLMVFGPVAAFVVGLGLTFATLQIGRGQERESAGMRRMLYGFNAVFSTLLLASILLLINVLPYNASMGPYDFFHRFFAATFDWTQSRVYSLSDRTRNTLASLEEPVKVYILMDSRDPITPQVETLLENFRSVNPRITLEQISSLSAEKLQKLPQKIQEKITDPRGGLLVVYGDESKEQAQFIAEDKLYKVEPGDEAGGERLLFQGEGALLQSIRYLTENADKHPVVYFAQGDGELDFNDARGESTDGMGVVLRLMRKTEIYDLKDLKFTADVTTVPADAEAVVVARPQRLKPAALKAIYNYMGYDYDEAAKAARDLPREEAHKPGKLFVLLDVQVQNGKMLQTGLEPLLSKLGVQAGDDRVLTLQDPAQPAEIDAATTRNGRNPVAKAFAAPNRVVFHFSNVRSMQPAVGPPGPYSADPLLVTDTEPVWEETDLVTAPDTIAQARIKQPGGKFSDAPIPLAVAVSETKSGMPNDEAHAKVANEGRPRVVAFGNAGWLSNDGLLGSPDRESKYALFTSCLSWLREKPDIGAMPVEADETKARIPYHANLSSDAAWTLQLLPLAQMILAVIAGGIGVWLVRRR